MSSKMLRAKLAAMSGTALAVFLSAGSAQALNIADSPLFLSTAAEPLVMLTLSNDEQLYHKAYTDFDDVDGDRLIDIGYKDTINYSGYFDAKKCYGYNGTVDAGKFEPKALALGGNSHHCDTVSGGRWSGNFLNWASMSRMDVLRKVLYGGFRQEDTATSTVLERVYLPSDNHAWIKLYNGTDLEKYTPYSFSSTARPASPCATSRRGAPAPIGRKPTRLRRACAWPPAPSPNGRRRSRGNAFGGASSPRSTWVRARMMGPRRKLTSSRCASKCATRA